MLLIHWCVNGSSVNLRRGGDHYPGSRRVSRRLQHVESAANIGVHVAFRRFVGIRNSDQGSQVEHYVAAAHLMADKLRIPHIPEDNLDRVSDLWRHLLQVTP